MSKDHELGMDRKITRRDFVEGASVAFAGSMIPGSLLAATGYQGAGKSNYYPPGLSGLRGSHVGSFEVAHQLAREKRTDWGPAEDADGMVYDLVVVGAGVSGLTAAHLYQKEHPDATILILDNHDDFGGHAKRNEFSYGGQKHIGYGGSQSILDPGGFSRVAKRLLKDLTIDVDRFDTAFDQNFNKRFGLSKGIYFDRKTYGVDRVVKGTLLRWDSYSEMEESQVFAEEAIPNMPISEEAKRQLLGLYNETKDRVPDHSMFGEPDYLQSISYRDFISKHMGVTDPQALGLMQHIVSDISGIDVLPALWAMVLGFPGIDATSIGKLQGLIKWAAGVGSEPYIYHFPDGNASVARLLVRRLIPEVAPGNTMEDIVTAPFDYSRLDRSDSPVRLRLSRTVVHVRNIDDAKTAKETEVTYVRGGKTYRVRARGCVLACYNQIIPYLCPELPSQQKEALSKLVKLPLVYTNVMLRNWQAWKKLGISNVYCPGTYHHNAMLDYPVSLGEVEFSHGPDEPVICHMNRIPAKIGLSGDDQRRAGRMELLTTSFEAIERDIRTHLGGMLGSEGFDPAVDIEGITVNRWPHGYAWSANPIWNDYEEDELPFVVGRQRFGRIVVANSDAGGEPTLNMAIDQAHRAIEDLEG